MAVRDDVVIRIIADTKKSVASMVKFAAGITAAVMAVKGITRAVSDMLDAYKVQEQAEAKLEAAIKATGGAAGLTATQLKNYAAELQSVTTFGDEAIIEAQAMMLTFRNIGKETFPRAIEATADLATMMGTDLKSAVIQLGKALNDPKIGLTALTRSGITFTEAQKELIKGFSEANDFASAQAIILKEVEMQMGGTAKAMAETATGAMTQFQNALGDLKEIGGQVVAEGLAPIVTILKDVATEFMVTRQLLSSDLFLTLTTADASAQQLLRIQTQIIEKEEILTRISEEKLSIWKITNGLRALDHINEMAALREKEVAVLRVMEVNANMMDEQEARGEFDKEAAQAARDALAAGVKRLELERNAVRLAEAYATTVEARREKLLADIEFFDDVWRNSAMTAQAEAVVALLRKQLAALEGQTEEQTEYNKLLDETADIWAQNIGPSFIDALGMNQKIYDTTALWADEIESISADSFVALNNELAKLIKLLKEIGEEQEQTNISILGGFTSSIGAMIDVIEGDYVGAIKGVVDLIGSAFGPQGTAVAGLLNAGIDLVKTMFSDPVVAQVSKSLADALKRGIADMDHDAVKNAILEQMQTIMVEVAFSQAYVQNYVRELTKWMNIYVKSIGTPQEEYNRQAVQLWTDRLLEGYFDAEVIYNNLGDTFAGGLPVLQPTAPQARAGVVNNYYGTTITEDAFDSRIAGAVGSKASGY